MVAFAQDRVCIWLIQYDSSFVFDIYQCEDNTDGQFPWVKCLIAEKV